VINITTKPTTGEF